MPAKGKRLLVTGFAPFGGEAINPSWEIVKALPDVMAGYRIEKLRVPVEFGKSVEVAARAIDRFAPELVLCVGQAGGRSRLAVERIAINIDDARIPDNAGNQHIDQPIDPAAPSAYFCTVPIKAMVAAMLKAGAPAEVSNSAGTYVCNHLIFGVLHHLALTRAATRAGFIHVPYAESQILDKPGTAALSLATMSAGVKAAIIAAARRRADLKLVGGQLH
ncbi:MAG TPA: pyroglutamyl-peptidase I [Usitatibacteraceae bacterium]|nr:pyroglutamyl-peptidase I [Usitatibacteraceae bacterium]